MIQINIKYLINLENTKILSAFNMKQKPYEMFKALSDNNRLKIISLLYKKGPLGTTKISESLGMSPSAISQHLRILKNTGLVTNDRSGYWVSYKIDINTMSHCSCMLTRLCQCGSACNLDDYDDISPDILSLYRKWLDCEIKKIDKIIKAKKTKTKGD